MSYYIRISGQTDGTQGPFAFCQPGEWRAFCKWVGALPPAYKALKDLADDGVYKGTMDLGVELELAKEKGRVQPGIAHLVEKLLEYTEDGEDEEYIAVTDE